MRPSPGRTAFFASPWSKRLLSSYQHPVPVRTQYTSAGLIVIAKDSSAQSIGGKARHVAQELRLRLQRMKGELVDRAKAVAQVFRLARGRARRLPAAPQATTAATSGGGRAGP
jgi:hypothetical protein